MEFSEYLQWDRMAGGPVFLRHPVCIGTANFQNLVPYSPNFPYRWGVSTQSNKTLPGETSESFITFNPSLGIYVSSPIYRIYYRNHIYNFG